MLITLLEVAALLVVIIAPMGGPAKRRKNLLLIDTDVSRARYAVNAEGCLVKIPGRELSKYEL